MNLARRALVAVGVTIAIAGAGCDDPYADVRDDPKPSPTPPPAEQPTSEPTATPTPSEAELEPAPLSTPESALRMFGERWTNWSWRDSLPRRELVQIATGRIRAYLLQQASQPLDSGGLEKSKPEWKGSVVAVNLQADRGERRRAVVVLREQQYERGKRLPDGLHYTVYLAEVARVKDGWAVSEWEGQP